MRRANLKDGSKSSNNARHQKYAHHSILCGCKGLMRPSHKTAIPQSSKKKKDQIGKESRDGLRWRMWCLPNRKSCTPSRCLACLVVSRVVTAAHQSSLLLDQGLRDVRCTIWPFFALREASVLLLPQHWMPLAPPLLYQPMPYQMVSAPELKAKAARCIWSPNHQCSLPSGCCRPSPVMTCNQHILPSAFTKIGHLWEQNTTVKAAKCYDGMALPRGDIAQARPQWALNQMLDEGRTSPLSCSHKLWSEYAQCDIASSQSAWNRSWNLSEAQRSTISRWLSIGTFSDSELLETMWQKPHFPTATSVPGYLLLVQKLGLCKN